MRMCSGLHRTLTNPFMWALTWADSNLAWIRMQPNMLNRKSPRGINLPSETDPWMIQADQRLQSLQFEGGDERKVVAGVEFVKRHRQAIVPMLLTIRLAADDQITAYFNLLEHPIFARPIINQALAN